MNRPARVAAASPERRHAPWLFLLATLAWTWSSWIVVAYLHASEAAEAEASLDGLTLLLFAVGGFGPAIVASLLVLAGHADEALAAFWRRALDARLLRARGWLAAFLLAVAAPGLGWLVMWSLDEEVALGATGFLLVAAIAGLAEEPGWRGYAQEGLQRRMPVAAAALVVSLTTSPGA